MGDEIKLTTGVVSSKTGFQGDISLYQISAAVQPGNSGGPLFDHGGNLIGIVNAKHKGAENVGYAIKTSYLNSLIESVMSTNILPGTNNISNMPLTNKVKSLKNFVFMITCSSTSSSKSSAVPSKSGNITSTKSTYRRILGDEIHVYNPQCTKDSNSALELKEVIITSNKTILKLHYSNYNRIGGWCSIDPESYISVNGVQYRLKNAIGIAKSPQKTSFDNMNDIDFSLEFPAIPKSTSVISFTKSIGSTWNIQNIKLK
jgi:hypothetical protein